MVLVCSFYYCSLFRTRWMRLEILRTWQAESGSSFATGIRYMKGLCKQEQVNILKNIRPNGIIHTKRPFTHLEAYD